MEHDGSLELPNVRLDRLRIVSWNVFFADGYWIERLHAALCELRALDPHVICLQEVMPRSLNHILAHAWIRNNFVVSDGSGKTLQPYGVVILSRLPVKRFIAFDLVSRMNRKLLLAEIEVNTADSIVVGCVHLESLPEFGAFRVAQILDIRSHLEPYWEQAALVVIAGDTNVATDAPEELALVATPLIDMWPMLYPDDPGLTQDTASNEMLRKIKRKAFHVRYDRCLFFEPGHVGLARRLSGPPVSLISASASRTRSLTPDSDLSSASSSSAPPSMPVLDEMVAHPQRPRWRPEYMARIGTRPLATPERGGRSDKMRRLFPSDHFGLVASFALSASAHRIEAARSPACPGWCRFWRSSAETVAQPGPWMGPSIVAGRSAVTTWPPTGCSPAVGSSSTSSSDSSSNAGLDLYWRPHEWDYAALYANFPTPDVLPRSDAHRPSSHDFSTTADGSGGGWLCCYGSRPRKRRRRRRSRQSRSSASERAFSSLSDSSSQLKTTVTLETLPLPGPVFDASCSVASSLESSSSSGSTSGVSTDASATQTCSSDFDLSAYRTEYVAYRRREPSESSASSAASTC
ncbi:endonuclease/exonuclease/phosphatase family protein [Thecamonas trahens ATCC 50062]|uniref:Endonuclease/exonuclease/phosphatase family protein n=1 Tax=Thecamonas trahens ATCC 50062 TaxID=461836 RepID=A0A0L0DHV4_THETB|nr:endonuclease/exonuclease/phosphatase family protein [Thecamonas trahens ATCC 50062]KNC50883.1 endonuclease/exonuclease/phosphatase family protein [Thecamonas trahens ATCC 50062]|eukprot:XP_013756590.1 endonuclease/exonuclease/phosphatase family protein [Thecamonas trahens ATCC 50062]